MLHKLTIIFHKFDISFLLVYLTYKILHFTNVTIVFLYFYNIIVLHTIGTILVVCICVVGGPICFCIEDL